MRTTSGILQLGKREREALKVVREHTLRNLSWREGGSSTNLDGNGEFDTSEAKKAELGLNVINFILKITE